MPDAISLSVPAGPLISLGRWILPPVINFGSPVQRSKNEQESFWHISVTIRPRLFKRIGPAVLFNCQFYLHEYEGNVCINKILLSVGDAAFVNPSLQGNLIAGEVTLVPIAWRSEVEGGGNGYIADTRFFEKKERAYPIPPDRKKHFYKLVMGSGKFACESPHFYRLRVPRSPSNGHFVLELDYQGIVSQ
jgi:hypothetical protein